MTLLELLHSSPFLFTALCAVLGLIVGSFLNVVIYRVPLMLQHDWRLQSQEYLQLNHTDLAPTVKEHKVFNLVKPGSHCPACKHPIRPWHNIPVLSYLLLGGRCADCGHHIHWRYPAVEILSAALSALVAWHFGASFVCLSALVFTWILLSLAIIDFDHQLLPDNMTLPLLWLGLVLSVLGGGSGVSPSGAIIGSAAGYLSLWSIYWIFKLLTDKEGMGYGDFKLLAALGAWLGPGLLPAVIVISSLSGVVVGLCLMVFAGHNRHTPIPFGPYLAAAGFLTLLWGEKMNYWYLNSMAGI